VGEICWYRGLRVKSEECVSISINGKKRMVIRRMGRKKCGRSERSFKGEGS
jgi:hypothetical protein